ncbi:hypothetical protein ACH5RR_030702 [Cinchona calisaya]|uniref:Late embryogenesis abundant protein LEA-2 subgroup domain-containing protein n=1 Tax=Cinchona calisaya TaxID=153742 RepID=A0ABD2YXJ7_9GENT
MSEPISESPNHHTNPNITNRSSKLCGTRKTPRGLKICCGITTVLLIAIIVVALVLFFTILKPKNPKITTESVTLDYIKYEPIPIFHLNITLSIVITVDNRNYASFKYENSTVFVTYRGIPAAQGPIQQDTIPARAKHDIGTSVVIVVDNFSSNPDFLGDFTSGSLNFTSTTFLHGKATVLKLLKIKVSTYTTCDISVFINFQNASSVCQSKVKY